MLKKRSFIRVTITLFILIYSLIAQYAFSLDEIVLTDKYKLKGSIQAEEKQNKNSKENNLKDEDRLDKRKARPKNLNRKKKSFFLTTEIGGGVGLLGLGVAYKYKRYFTETLISWTPPIKRSVHAIVPTLKTGLYFLEDRRVGFYLNGGISFVFDHKLSYYNYFLLINLGLDYYIKGIGIFFIESGLANVPTVVTSPIIGIGIRF